VDAEVAGNGGVAYGGGVDLAGGTASLAGSELQSNAATGGKSGSVPASSINSDPGTGGNAYGGGLYAGGGTSTLTNDTVTGNDASGGGSTFTGQGYGGGIEIASAASVSLDSFTVNNTNNNYMFNSVAGGTSNIYGTYILRN
jgi:hypothetical protein